MSHEIAIFQQNQWEEGDFSGGEATENNFLTNRLKRLNDDSFNNPINSSFNQVIDINNFTEIKRDGNNINLKIDKPDNEDIINNSRFCKMDTAFFQDSSDYNIEYLSLNFDWKAYKTDQKENCNIVLKDGAGSTHTISLTNKSEIELTTYDGSTEYNDFLRDSSPESIGDIESILTNDLQDWNLDIQLEYDTEASIYNIKTRVRAYGYISKWYSRPFGPNKISTLDLVMDAINDSNSIVKKELNIRDIFVEGYENSIAYTSKVLDSGENDSIWNEFILDGIFPVGSLPTTTTNQFRVNLVATNDIDGFDSSTRTREYTVTPDNSEYTYQKDLESAEELKGRYLKIKLAPSIDKHYQNNINFIKTNYTLASELDSYTPQMVTEETVSETIDSTGGVVHMDTGNFPAKLYVPPNAVETSTTFTMTRLAGDNTTFAEDMISFDFSTDGASTFDIPLMLEIDYANFDFDTYQSEEGLKLSYIDNEDGPQDKKTIIDSDRKKAFTYLSHFSQYALVATDNLYSYRTYGASQKHPRWMELREKDSNFQQIVNHGIYSELDKISQLTRQVTDDYFISTIDADMKYIAFKTHAKNFTSSSGEILNIEDESSFQALYMNKSIPITTSQADFNTAKKEVCLYERETDMLYFEQPYEKAGLSVVDGNNITYTLEKKLDKHHIWNLYDEIAMLFDLERIPEETNEELKARILDANKNPSNSTETGLKNHISRELGLDKTNISVNSLKDDKYMDTLTNADGSASDKLESIANYINNHISISWNSFKWDEGYWFSDIENVENYNFI